MFRLFKDLEDGTRTSFQDAPREGRPVEACYQANIDQVKSLVDDDCHISTRQIEESVDVSHGSVLNIHHDHLKLKNLCSRWVPHELTQQNKDQRVQCATAWIENFHSTEIRKLVFIDEKGFYLRSVGTKSSNKAWVADIYQKPKLAPRTISDKKFMAVVAMTLEGVWYCEVLENGKSINIDVYVSCIQNMHEKFVHHRQPLRYKDMILIQDNARPHVSRTTLEFIARKKITLWKQAPYSPDLNLLDRWIFSELEAQRNIVSFGSIEDLKEFLFTSMPKFTKENCAHQFHRLMTHLNDVIKCQGDYV